MRRRPLTLLVLGAAAIGSWLLMGGTAAAAPPKLKISNVMGSESGGDLKFIVRLSARAERKVTVDWETLAGDDVSDERNAAAGTEYTPGGGTVIFKPGVTKRPIIVDVMGDELDDHDRGFRVSLSSARRAKVADGIGKGTITDDDDPPTVTITPEQQIKDEPPSGVNPASWTIQLSEPSNRSVTVDMAITGTATNDVDYTTDYESGTFLFSPGDTQRTPTVAILADADHAEGFEFIIATLSSPDGATLGSPSVATISVAVVLP